MEKHIGENASATTAPRALFSLFLIDSLFEPLDRMRIGAFFLDSPVVLLSETLTLPKRLPLPQDDRAKTIQCTGTCLLTAARTGIWIAGKPIPHRDLDLLLLSFFSNLSNGGFRSATGSVPCVQHEHMRRYTWQPSP